MKSRIRRIAFAVAASVATATFMAPAASADGLAALQARAESGNAVSQYYLAVAYRYGDGAPKNHAEAVRWFRKAAEQGHVVAQFYMGYCYWNGEGVAKDQAEAMRWYRKAADQGDAQAQYNLGVGYANGQGVALNDAEAVRLYRLAAAQGHESAVYALRKRGLDVSGGAAPAPQAAPAPATNTSVPATGGSAPISSPAAASRLPADVAALRALFDTSGEDKVFSLIAELGQTGRIDLAREARDALAKRFPGSPLLPVAMQLVDSLMSGNTGSPATASAGVSPAAPALAALDIQGLRRLVEAEFGPARDTSSSGTEGISYEVVLKSGTFTIPVVFELSTDGSNIWFRSNVGDAFSADKAALALKRVGQIQPTMIWETSYGKTRFGLHLKNRGVTQAEVKSTMEKLAKDVADSAYIWNR